MDTVLDNELFTDQDSEQERPCLGWDGNVCDSPAVLLVRFAKCGCGISYRNLYCIPCYEIFVKGDKQGFHTICQTVVDILDVVSIK